MTTDARAPGSASLAGPKAPGGGTAEALRIAILRLSAEQHVDRLSVAQIAAAADIHRVTFYEHARSPSALLARVMGDELDAVHAAYLASSYINEHSLAEAIRHTSMAIAALVDSHSAIFEHLLAESSRTTAHDLLAPHFETSVLALIDHREQHHGRAQSASGEGQSRQTDAASGHSVLANSALARSALARYVAYGSVGAIEVWFGAGTAPTAAFAPAPNRARDPEEYYALIEPLLPRWLVA